MSNVTEILHTTTTGAVIRTAEFIDIDNIVSLVESAYRGQQAKQGWTTEAEFIDGQRTDRLEVETLMNTPGNAFLLCEQNNKLLATVHLKHRQPAAWLGMFAVDPQLQAQGLGASLLQQAELYARNSWHCDTMKMLVITIREELIDWYLRKGYQKTGKFHDFPYYEPRFGLPKRDDLKLEVLLKPLKISSS